MKKHLYYMWQFMQNIIGVGYLLVSKATYKENVGDVRIYTTSSKYGSVSLGNLVFISNNTRDYSKTLTHELGHTLQSKVLGPFYLFVIGIPSFLWASLRKICKSLRKIDYYWFYTEAWADKWAGKYLSQK